MGGSDDWGDWSGPSAEELLRQEYPDLMDKWNGFKKKEDEYKVVWKQLGVFTFLERLLNTKSYIHAFSVWTQARQKIRAAEEESLFLTTRLRDEHVTVL